MERLTVAHHRREVAHLAERFSCDPSDPVFGILEAVYELKDELVARSGGKDAKAVAEAWTGISSRLEQERVEYEALVKQMREGTQNLESFAKGSAQLLLASRQLTLRDRLISATIGALFTALPILGIAAYLYSRSLDYQLARTHVQTRIEKGPRGTRVTLEGREVLLSGQSKTRIVAEFAP